MSDAVGENVRDRRALKRASQTDLAGWMGQLGFDWWSHTTVSEIERGRRPVSVDELVSLAIVLGVDVQDLLDPIGADGSRTTPPVDYGRTNYRTLPAVIAHHWMRGNVRVRFHGPDSYIVEQVGDHEAEYAECERAQQEWDDERASAPGRAEELRRRFEEHRALAIEREKEQQQ
jgi:transcriptional regulator with XRE-family HTH domain